MASHQLMIEGLPDCGVGLVYHPEMRNDVSRFRDKIDYLELIADRVLSDLGLQEARFLAGEFRLLFHGLRLSIGSDQLPDTTYVKSLATVVQKFGPHWISDHIALTRVGDIELGRLLPVPFSADSASVICRNVRHIQLAFGCPFLLENIAYYFIAPGTELDEASFITSVLEATNSGMLLDLNNLYVNSVNHGYDPYRFLSALPLQRVIEVHIAGHAWRDEIAVDTHGHAVDPEVWALLEWVCAHARVRAVTLERDQNIPDFSEIVSELDRMRAIWQQGRRLSSS